MSQCHNVDSVVSECYSYTSIISVPTGSHSVKYFLPRLTAVVSPPSQAGPAVSVHSTGSVTTEEEFHKMPPSSLPPSLPTTNDQECSWWWQDRAKYLVEREGGEVRARALIVSVRSEP